MSRATIAQILAQARAGQSDSINSADAVMESQAVAPPANAAQANPYVLNQALETAAQPNRAPLHPLVAAIMSHLGLMNVIRNRGNEPLVDLEGPPQ